MARGLLTLPGSGHISRLALRSQLSILLFLLGSGHRTSVARLRNQVQGCALFVEKTFCSLHLTAGRFARYALERHSFGKPISRLGPLKH